MFKDKGRAVTWLVAGAILGVPLRLVLDAGFGDDMVLLGAVNAVGWFVLGLTSGKWGSKVARLRVGLGAFGVAAFSSWATLAFHGATAAGEILIAFIEAAFGLLIAVIGHLVTMPRGRDL